MATVRKNILKKGISYTIQVRYKGKFYSKTWLRPNNLTEHEIKRELEKIKVDYENQVRLELDTKNTNITFLQCSTEWLKKIRSTSSINHYMRSVDIVKSLNEYFGNKLLRSIGLKDVENYFILLNNKQITINKVRLIKSLDEIIKGVKIKDICSNCDFTKTTFQYVRKNKYIDIKTAQSICKHFNINFNEYFENKKIIKGYEYETKLRYKRTLSAILNFAIKHEYINKNYASSLYIGNVVTGEKNEKDILNEQETENLNTALDKENNLKRKVAISILFFMGLRIGELSGLEWKDIDFENKTMKINRSISFIPGQGEHIKAPKTKKSKRKLKIPNKLFDLLIKYKVLYDEERKKLGKLWVDKDRIICRWNGDTTTSSTYANWLSDILISNGLRKVSPHSLRHTCITTLLRNKVPVTVVSQWAGHSSVAMTLNTYAHYLPEDENVCANALDEIFNIKFDAPKN